MSLYFPPDDKRRPRQRRRTTKIRNEKLDFPPVKKAPPGWVVFLINQVASFIVNIIATLFYPAIVAVAFATIAILRGWLGFGS